jgi:hypothetical protein
MSWHEAGIDGSKDGYQRGNQNPYIEEEQTTQWPKDSVCQVNA